MVEKPNTESETGEITCASCHHLLLHEDGIYRCSKIGVIIAEPSHIPADNCIEYKGCHGCIVKECRQRGKPHFWCSDSPSAFPRHWEKDKPGNLGVSVCKGCAETAE